ncbi:hypothetical protein [Marinobacter sediminum]|uniref:hypothetical protein n=1 Tax=Marinobacter sediminum TaxID=256323 RepID=UPI00193A51AC|nr:hypothetical protein [Marinobacter sediminum]
MHTHRFTLALLIGSMPAFAADPVTTDGDKYTVLLENSCVRVLEYRDQPGDITHEHQHPAFVLYALTPFDRVIHLPDGKVINRSFKAGDVIWSPAQTHTGANTGSSPSHAIIVESKASGSRLSECSEE